MEVTNDRLPNRHTTAGRCGQTRKTREAKEVRQRTRAKQKARVLSERGPYGSSFLTRNHRTERRYESEDRAARPVSRSTVVGPLVFEWDFQALVPVKPQSLVRLLVDVSATTRANIKRASLYYHSDLINVICSFTAVAALMLSYSDVATALSSTALRVCAYIFLRWVCLHGTQLAV